MNPVLDVVLIILGLLTLFQGRRLWLLAAATGALLGLALLRLVPGLAGGFVGAVIIVGLAVLGGVLGVLFKSMARLIMMGIGFIAGGAVVIVLLDMLGMSLGLGAWLLALIGGIVGLVLINRFFDWGLVIVAALVGAGLTARGVQLLAPTIGRPVFILIWVALLVVGIVYQARAKRK